MTQPGERPAVLDFFLSPLVAITAAADQQRGGLIAGMAFLVSPVAGRERFAVSIWKSSFTHELIVGSDAFALHILANAQDELVYQLGLSSGRDADKLSQLDHEIGITDSPLLRDCLEVFDCRVINQMDGGEMTVFLGESVQTQIRRASEVMWRHEIIARMPDGVRAVYEANRSASAPPNAVLRDMIRRCVCAENS